MLKRLLPALAALALFTVGCQEPAPPADHGHAVRGLVSTALTPVSAPLGLSDIWIIQANPAAAAQATISKAASTSVSNRHVALAIYATLSAGATAATPVNLYLRDGATGAGTVLWSSVLSVPASTTVYENVQLPFPGIAGTAGNAMTLEFSGAGAAATVETVTLQGYDTAP